MCMWKLIKNISFLLLIWLVCFNTILVSQTLKNKVDVNDRSLKHVKLQLKYKHQFQFAGYYAAFNDFYKKAGFNVEIIEGSQKQDDPLENVLSGEIDYGIGDVEIIEARMLGKPIMVIAAIFQNSHHILLTKKNNNIRKPSDLIGKKVMINPNHVGMFQLISIFFRESIDIGTIDIIRDRWSIRALTEDSVAVLSAYISQQPYELEKKFGFEPYSIKTEDYGVNFYGDMLFTSEENAINNREEVLRFRQATIDGWDYAFSHEDEIIDYILNNTNVAQRGITYEQLKYEAKQIKDVIVYGYITLGNINPGRIESIAKTIIDAKDILVKNKIIEKLNHNYSLDNLDGFIFDPNPIISNTPKIIRNISIGFVLVVVLSIFTVYYFRKKVKDRTIDLENEIKQRRLFEETLVTSEQRYKSLFENSPLCILEVNYSEMVEFLDNLKANITSDLTTFLMENPSVLESCRKKLKVTNINREGISFLKLDDTDINENSESPPFKIVSNDKFVKQMVSIFEKKYQTEYEIIILLHDGEQKQVIARSSSYGNNYQKVLISLTDITEIKNIEYALYESEKNFKTLSYEFQTILDSVPDAILVLDNERKLIWMNNLAANEQFFGKIERNALFCCKTLLKEDFTCKVCTIRDAAFTETQKTREFTVQNGNKIWELRTIPLVNENKLVSIIVMFRDNTMKKRIEEEIFKREKIESVGILAGGIAHDFNNILTSILGNVSLAKLLTRKGNSEKVIKSLESAEKSAIRAKDLAFQLLTFSKGGDPIKKQTKLKNIVIDSANCIMPGSQNKLEIIIPDDLWITEIDPGQIGQVIQNLVINADQATKDPGTIIVTCDNVVIDSHNRGNLNIKNGNYVRVSVKDEGIGIPDELKNKIFDPYFSTKPVGSGLGLTICYNIIEKHQGDLKFNSTVNEGSEFYFYLPVATNIEHTKKDISTDNNKNSIAKGKIMVIDDEEMVRDLVFDMLTNLGYDVECFPEGGSAINKYKEVIDSEPFDLVITDLVIPEGIGGKEVLNSILEINPKAKIIVSSGYSNDPMMAEHAKYGFKAVIPKPYDVESLTQTIQNTLRN